jgi:hypothetical protein
MPRMRNCGACARWGSERDAHEGARPCMFPIPSPRPFWLELDDGQQWTRPTDGDDCLAFEPMEDHDDR